MRPKAPWRSGRQMLTRAFLSVISGIFQECGRVLKNQTGRLVFTFHHWDPAAWAELTIGLKQAGFRLVNVYAVSSEHPISVHINNLNSIKHDAILVLTLDGNASTQRWMPFKTIDTSDSETFCRQCGSTLGWLLENDLAPAEHSSEWKRLIQGKTQWLTTQVVVRPRFWLSVRQQVRCCATSTPATLVSICRRGLQQTEQAD